MMKAVLPAGPLPLLVCPARQRTAAPFLLKACTIHKLNNTALTGLQDGLKLKLLQHERSTQNSERSNPILQELERNA